MLEKLTPSERGLLRAVFVMLGAWCVIVVSLKVCA